MQISNAIPTRFNIMMNDIWCNRSYFYKSIVLYKNRVAIQVAMDYRRIACCVQMTKMKKVIALKSGHPISDAINIIMIAI